MTGEGSVFLGSAYASILLDQSQLQSGISSAQKQFKDFGKGLQDTGKSLLGLTAPLVAFGALAVKQFADQQKGLAQLDAVLKSTGQSAGVTRDQAIDLANGLSQVTAYSDDAVLSGENLLLTFTGIKKDAFEPALKAAMDMSTAMGTDLNSSIMMVAKSLNAPAEGLAALTRNGVTFTEAQKDMIKQMVAVGDTAGAQKIILGELNKEFGGSSIAAGQTFAGGLAILNNQFQQILATIGGAIVPVLQNLINQMMPVINQVAEWISKNPELIGQIAQVVIVAFALGTGLTVVGGIITSVTTIVGLLTGALAFLLSPAGLLIAAIVGIIYALNELYPGGIKKLLADFMISAMQLAVVLHTVLAPQITWVSDRIKEFEQDVLTAINTVQNLLNIIDLVRSGKVSLGDVAGAVGSEIGNNAGNSGSGSLAARLADKYWPPSPMPASGGSGGSGGQGFAKGGNSGLQINGDVHINASTREGGIAAAQAFEQTLNDRYRGRGN